MVHCLYRKTWMSWITSDGGSLRVNALRAYMQVRLRIPFLLPPLPRHSLGKNHWILTDTHSILLPMNTTSWTSLAPEWPRVSDWSPRQKQVTEWARLLWSHVLLTALLWLITAGMKSPAPNAYILRNTHTPASHSMTYKPFPTPS